MPDNAEKPLVRHSLTNDAVMMMKWQAEVLLRARDFIPSRYQSANQILAVMMMADEIGVKRMVAIRNMYAIDGKVACEGKLMLALARRTGEMESFKIEGDKTQATCTIKRKGNDPVAIAFTIEDAKDMGLLEGRRGENYRKQPATMLRWRAIGANLQITFPDVLMGMYFPEEIGVPVKVVEGEIVIDETAMPKHTEPDANEPQDIPTAETPQVRAPAPRFDEPQKSRKVGKKRTLHPTQEAKPEPAHPVEAEEETEGQTTAVGPKATMDQREQLKKLFLATFESGERIISDTERAKANQALRADGTAAYWTKMIASLTKLVQGRLTAAAKVAEEDNDTDEDDDELPEVEE